MDENDFESQYADELDILNEIDKENEQLTNGPDKSNSIIIKPITNEEDDEFAIFEEKDNENDEEINLNNKKGRFNEDDTVIEKENVLKESNSNIVIEKMHLASPPQPQPRPKISHYIQDLRKYKYLNVTYSNGQKSTIKLFDEPPKIDQRYQNTSYIGLLETPIEKLKLQITNEIIDKCKKSIQETNENDELMDYQLNSNEENLWVEKYKPKNYLDLLSDDGINRLLLTWMKSWDYFVFNKEYDQNQINNHKKSLINDKKRKRTLFTQNELELEEKLLELDSMKRPKIKVALLAGPPGLGKTTLAHIIAKTAGYNVIEMNASDDRNTESFKQLIDSVTQFRGNVNDTKFKPNCLVIDEIDGASQQAIQLLVSLIIGDTSSKGSNDQDDAQSDDNRKSTKSKESIKLLRPIICICNDLYSPNLKQLRQNSIVFQVPVLVTYRLSSRLAQICDENKLGFDLEALNQLCDKTNNDIRSCLNTLQFLSKSNKQITSQLVNSYNCGLKDYEKGIFFILNEIFFLSQYKRRLKLNNSQSNKKDKLNYIYTLLNSNCDLNKLILSIHENLYNLRYRDTNYDITSSIYDWFLFMDKVNNLIKEKQEYCLYDYLKFLPLFCTHAFNSSALNQQLIVANSKQNSNGRLQYPYSLMESVYKLQKNESILKHFLNDINASMRCLYNSYTINVIDLLPYLINDIIQPTQSLRAISIQLFNKKEIAVFNNIINIMLSFNLNYRQERQIDGQYAYALDPSLDLCLKFGNNSVSSGLKQRKQLCYMIKQQIARELNIAKLKLMDKTKINKSTSIGLQSPAIKSKIFQQQMPANSPKTLKDLQKRQQDSLAHIKKEEQTKKPPASDMFARYFKKIPKQESEDEELANNIIKRKKLSISPKSEPVIPKYSTGVWLKYKEGFVNAVRYNIKINKLL